MSFNPDDFFNKKNVEDVVKMFPHLEELDYTISSLNDELIKVNYEIVSSEYKDFTYSSIEDYYSFEVDEIV